MTLRPYSARVICTRLRAIAAVCLTLPLLAQTSGIHTYCNPIDVDYKYNFEQTNEGISYRAAADPVIVNHKSEYYLFATISGGWWHSTDLIHWNFVRPDKWPFEDVCAPAALSDGEGIYIFQSTFEQRPILYTTAPATGHVEFFNRWMPLLPGAYGPWDPDIFHDPRSGQWFMYFGSSDTFPIYGIELDPKKHLTYIGKAKPLLLLHPDQHGWERFGQDHRDARRPFIEGATMTEHHGKYYLQYAAPGTEYNVYANGTYIGDSPLGPFSYAPYKPISYKPGGFMAGAGHGNTFQDKYGNWWNTGTPWVAVNWNFERRMSMFPAGFDRDGQLFSNTRFGDFPHYVPTRKWTSKDELFTGWMLLSYRKPVTASSTREGFVASNVTDENPRTFWVAGTSSAGEWITIDLKQEYDVKAVQVNFTDYKSNIFSSDDNVYTQFRMYSSSDRKTWTKIADLTGEKRDRPNAYIELPHAVRARYVKYEHVHVASPNLAISDIRVFGNGTRPAASTPANLTVRRDADPRNAFVSWSGVPGAVGYNVLWGIRKDKLYETYQRFADQGTTLEVRALNAGQDYWFSIEAFDENGVSKRGEIVHVP
ncbi:MAG: family 43 glycosylhydrolase [Thermoanaerobaculia bacterium]